MSFVARLVHVLVLALAAGCGAPPQAPREAARDAPRVLGLVAEGGLVRLEGPPPAAITVVGPEGACVSEALSLVSGGVRARCEGVALAGAHPDARLAPLVIGPLRGGGTVGSAGAWTVTLVYGPDEADGPGLPGHVQVKRGAQPVLRQNTWLRVERFLLVEAGEHAWLVLDAGARGEAYALDGSARRVAWGQ
ncbi:MAG: hypothetical protein KF729_29310 [Sandaracinaceae bacterium]|nr:hypothetical protein [Sandaracinaceae bacterium]